MSITAIVLRTILFAGIGMYIGLLISAHLEFVAFGNGKYLIYRQQIQTLIMQYFWKILFGGGVFPFILYIPSMVFQLNKEQKRIEKYNVTVRPLMLGKVKLEEMKFESLNQIHRANLQAIEDKYLQILNNKKSQKMRCVSFSNLLIDQFSDILDISDWENVDILIYYLTTNRADTLKEALQLLDRQKQTEMIVNEIHTANAAICQTLQQGFTALGQVVTSCFSRISDQLTQQHNEKMQELQTINNNMKELKIEMGAVATEISWANALQEKANATSAQLCQDIAYIRNRI